jgi:hypothetical protein
MSDQEDASPPSPVPLEIVIEPHQLAGVWANFGRVNHSEHEFTLDFVRIDYSEVPPKRGIVVARVAVSPLFITQLIDALQANWAEFAKKALPKEVYEDDEPGAGEPGEDQGT